MEGFDWGSADARLKFRREGGSVSNILGLKVGGASKLTLLVVKLCFKASKDWKMKALSLPSELLKLFFYTLSLLSGGRELPRSWKGILGK